MRDCSMTDCALCIWQYSTLQIAMQCNAGDPDLATTKEALLALDDVGCDIIELGVPYSDPLADGPTIQAAADRALRAGTTLQRVIDMLTEVSPSIRAPLVLFTYYNPIMARGLDKFCADVRAAGASGLLVPDIPLEETPLIREAVNKHGMELVLLTTPTTGAQAMLRVCQQYRLSAVPPKIVVRNVAPRRCLFVTRLVNALQLDVVHCQWPDFSEALNCARLAF